MTKRVPLLDTASAAAVQQKNLRIIETFIASENSRELKLAQCRSSDKRHLLEMEFALERAHESKLLQRMMLRKGGGETTPSGGEDRLEDEVESMVVEAQKRMDAIDKAHMPSSPFVSRRAAAPKKTALERESSTAMPTIKRSTATKATKAAKAAKHSSSSSTATRMALLKQPGAIVGPQLKAKQDPPRPPTTIRPMAKTAIVQVVRYDAVGAEPLSKAVKPKPSVVPLEKAVPLVVKTAPEDEKTALEVEKAALVVEKAAPEGEKTAPVVENAAPQVEKSAPPTAAPSFEALLAALVGSNPEDLFAKVKEVALDVDGYEVRVRRKSSATAGVRGVRALKEDKCRAADDDEWPETVAGEVLAPKDEQEDAQEGPEWTNEKDQSSDMAVQRGNKEEQLSHEPTVVDMGDRRESDDAASVEPPVPVEAIDATIPNVDNDEQHSQILDQAQAENAQDLGEEDLFVPEVPVETAIGSSAPVVDAAPPHAAVDKDVARDDSETAAIHIASMHAVDVILNHALHSPRTTLAPVEDEYDDDDDEDELTLLEPRAVELDQGGLDEGVVAPRTEDLLNEANSFHIASAAVASNGSLDGPNSNIDDNVEAVVDERPLLTPMQNADSGPAASQDDTRPTTSPNELGAQHTTAAAALQRIYRGYTGRQKFQKTLYDEAQACGVLGAMPGTTQGTTGWYQEPVAHTAHYFVVLPSGEWKHKVQVQCAKQILTVYDMHKYVDSVINVVDEE
ncbi:Aste57867_10037 [Aphanomyces stellatus]|uniref:Aste57867_10037 protein n=1 Tax=Aphanomyces stellatus TaxID=120398 RepID=A0A485KPC9_9STRA|nr:hypothetical protein As57867_009998 [Aphanomyces stellatus]VFT86914.1 Aste57867_10037 [Aphanomyces stellatus]